MQRCPHLCVDAEVMLQSNLPSIGLHTCLHTCLSAHMSAHTSVYAHVSTHAYTHADTYAWAQVMLSSRLPIRLVRTPACI